MQSANDNVSACSREEEEKTFGRSFKLPVCDHCLNNGNKDL